MRRILIIALLSLAVLLAAVLGLAFWLLNDPEFLKGQLAKYTREYTGRELRIEGPLKLDIGRRTTVAASGIYLGNAPWAQNPNMVEVGAARLSIDIPSLWGELLYLPLIHLSDCALELLENENGEDNWTFEARPDAETEEPADDDAILPFAVGELRIDRCGMVYDEPGRESPLTVRIESATLDRVAEGRAEGTVSGNVNGEPLEVSGWLAPARAFVEGGELRHELHFRAGDVALDLSGSLADAARFAGPNVSGRFRGPDIAKVLRDYSLPPMSDGAFDFRLDLVTREGFTDIALNGDLGTLDLRADGSLDKLLEPRDGKIDARIAGPDLHAFAQALGISNLVPEPFSLQARLDFDSGVLHLHEAVFETPAERLEAAGRIALREGQPGSQLTLSLQSDDVGRWAALAGRPLEPSGPGRLEAQAVTDDTGLLHLDATIDYLQSSLSLQGDVGPVGGPYAPDMRFDFHSDNMPAVAALLGEESFPAQPFDLRGRIRKQANALHIEDMEIVLDQHHAVVSGQLNLVKDYSGSAFDVDLDIPDVAELGLMFGIADLPSQPMKLSGQMQPQLPGLSFRVSDGNLGEIRLQAEGTIADLENPLGIDARFDIQLPGLRVVSFLLPDGLALPDGPFSASGSLENLQDRTRLHDIRLGLGDIHAALDGEITPDLAFDLAVEARGPDVSVLKDLIGKDLGTQPFDARTRLSGNPDAFELAGLDLTIGKSGVNGDLELQLQPERRVSGALDFSYLNLTPFDQAQPAQQPAAPSKPPRYVFDETPIMQFSDLGVAIDLDLKIGVLNFATTHVEAISAGISLNDNYLEVKPFALRGLTGGRFSGELTVDGRVGKPTLDLTLHAEEFRMGLALDEGMDPMALPPGNIRMTLKGRGETHREMASSLDGKVRVSFEQGEFAAAGLRFLMSDFLTELLNALNPFHKTSNTTRLDCAMAAVDIVSGQAALDPFIFNTEHVTIVTQGKIDLNTERLDLNFHSKARKGLGLSASNLINPFIKVGGTLASPSIELDPAGTVVKGGIAVATGGLSILARSMVDRFLSSKDPCGDALKDVAERDAETP